MASHDPAPERTDSGEPRTAVLAAAVFTVAVLVFAPAIDGPWLFDDHRLIVDNALVHGFASWTRWFTHSFWDTSWVAEASTEAGGFWRPWVLASYALDWTLGAGSPVVFHTTNLLLHGSASVLAYFALRRWLGVGWPALVVALFWAIHPSKAESVAWVAGRPDLLLTLGVLMALGGVAGRLRRRPWGLPLELCGACIAYGSKEHAVVLPVLVAVELLAHARWPEAGEIDSGALQRHLGRYLGPQLGLALGYLAARQWLLPIPAPSAAGGLVERASTVLETYGRFGVLTLWPADLSFGSSLSRVVDGHDAADPRFALLGALLLVTLALAALRWRSRSEVVAATALFPLLLVPVSNLIALRTHVIAAPRLLYLPLLGVALAAGLGLAARPSLRRITLPLCLVVLVSLGVRGVERARDFADARRLWTYEIAHSPRYLPALEFFVVQELRDGRPRSALRLAAHAFHGAAGTGGQAGAGTVLSHAFEALLLLTPDLDRAGLEALRRFVVDLRAGRAATLRGAGDRPQLSLPAGSEAARSLARHPMSLAALEARLASRLGDDERALELTREIGASCPECGEQRVLVPVAARAEDFRLAHQLVTNLARTQGPHAARDVVAFLDEAERRHAQALAAPPSMRAPLRAWFFSSVGAWGRAYQAARPALADPTLAHADGVTVAEIAFRAGDEEAARRLLARWEPPPAVEARIATWAGEMGWIDAPRPAEAALPEALAAVVAEP